MRSESQCNAVQLYHRITSHCIRRDQNLPSDQKGWGLKKLFPRPPGAGNLIAISITPRPMHTSSTLRRSLTESDLMVVLMEQSVVECRS